MTRRVMTPFLGECLGQVLNSGSGNLERSRECGASSVSLPADSANKIRPRRRKTHTTQGDAGISLVFTAIARRSESHNSMRRDNLRVCRNAFIMEETIRAA